MKKHRVPNFIVIDDDTINNIVCRRIIHHTYPEADIRTFTHPEAGLNYLETEFVSSSSSKTILFLDINMPAISGWDFLKSFDQLDDYIKGQLKIYILSSSIDPLDKVRSTSNKNVWDYIGKPLTKQAVEDAVNQVQEEENASLAREIHDELGQQLMRIKMDIAWLGSKIKSPDQQIKNKISEALALVDGTVETVRRINTDLRPRIIDDLGLFAALEWQANDFSEYTGVRCILNIDMNEPEFSKLLSGNVFRIFQEALTNIGKHAEAKTVNAGIKYLDANMILSIRDDGKGFDLKLKKDKSFGLLGMKERAAIVNGSVKIKSKPGKGTHIELTVPIII